MFRAGSRHGLRYLANQIMNRVIAFAVLLVVIVPALFLIINKVSAEDNIINRLQRDIRLLCSQDFAGRDVPGQYGDKTAVWLKEQFERIGLEPGIDDNEYLQKVPLISARLDTENTSIEFASKKGSLKLEWGENLYYFPRNIASFEKTVELKFANYGITLPGENRFDFQGDFTGKAAVVFAGSGDLSRRKAGRFAMTAFKAVAARKAGAAMIIVVHKSDNPKRWLPPNDMAKIATAGNPLTDLPNSTPDFPVINANFSAVKDLLFDANMKPLPEFDAVTVSFKSGFKDHKDVYGYNVCGKLPGKSDEYLLLGAHYDHLGIETEGEGETLVFFPGANDNATGIAGLLEVGRVWSQREKAERGLLLTAFTAEEDGMLGSKYFINNLPVSIESIYTMVNLDMIGGKGFASMREARQPDAEPDPDFANAYYSIGAPRLHEIIEATAKTGTLDLDITSVGRFPYNDGGPFHEKQIPTIHMFSGFDSDYSQITDTPDNLDWDKLMRLVLLTDQLLVNLNNEQGEIGFDPQIRSTGKGMKY
ncbi:MAG: M28 family peptidase [Calditrichaeota bacterium]|jgi:hypothetical protein|nr:M28 family peptidase [Calditrichota bacterium]